jgi:hypothetical protein
MALGLLTPELSKVIISFLTTMSSALEAMHARNPEKDPTAKAATCSSNWGAAKAIEEDKIHIFEQTGIFVLACRHGFVECIAEMKCSGELYVTSYSPYLPS